MNLSKVLVSDLSKNRSFDAGLLTSDFNEILNDEKIDLVIEVLGGVEPGRDYIKALLENMELSVTNVVLQWFIIYLKYLKLISMFR